MRRGGDPHQVRTKPSCVKTFLPSFKDHSQNVPLRTPKIALWHNISASHSQNLAGMFLLCSVERKKERQVSQLEKIRGFPPGGDDDGTRDSVRIRPPFPATHRIKKSRVAGIEFLSSRRKTTLLCFVDGGKNTSHNEVPNRFK